MIAVVVVGCEVCWERDKSTSKFQSWRSAGDILPYLVVVMLSRETARRRCTSSKGRAQDLSTVVFALFRLSISCALAFPCRPSLPIPAVSLFLFFISFCSRHHQVFPLRRSSLRVLCWFSCSFLRYFCCLAGANPVVSLSALLGGTGGHLLVAWPVQTR